VNPTVTDEIQFLKMFGTDVRIPTALARDCLRLATHFFHPIQQCAQQVYHTALPLSPTSSHLRNSCLPSVTHSRLSRVTAFSGAPDEWGSLLRTIDVRPGHLTCIATSAQRIIAACEDTVNIYDAAAFVLQQSLRAPEIVTKIQGSPDGSILFFAHSYSVTTWDVQTGGLTHTFTTRSKIEDIAVSPIGDHIACGSSDGSVAFWNIHTKKEGEGFGNGQPVVTIHWVSPLELAIATQGGVYFRDIATDKTSNDFSILGVWGMVYLPGSRDEFLVGVLQPGKGKHRELYSLICYDRMMSTHTRRSATYSGRLLSPTLVDDKIMCITPPNGVQLLDAETCEWTKSPLLLDAATSVAISLNRNLVAQTEDSIQIFSLDVLTSGEARNDVRPSHVYPLGEKHIVCLLQPNRRLIMLELETLRKIHPNDNTSPLRSLLTNKSPHVRASLSCGFVAEFGISVVVQALRSGTSLPEWTEEADEDPPLSGLSPSCARIATIYGSPRRELRVKNVKAGTILAKLSFEHGDLGTGNVYDVAFDSETRFHLKIDEPGRHVQIPYDIIPSPSGPHSHTITKGELVPLSQPRATPPYTLDVNCEWVVDAKSRKICWILPGNVRRGNGGHFWAGLSLVMVGGDGVVRKLTFREPDS
jgi:hypothetical protein